MEYGSAQGLPADMLATMSKHKGESLFDAYMTELCPDVMNVMSGHKAGDSYFVPRTDVELPYSLDECIMKCFPLNEHWHSEFAHDNGDSDKSARNFLFGVIPHLTRVIIQDAPYWLKYFPDHTYSHYLRQKFDRDFWDPTWREATGVACWCE